MLTIEKAATSIKRMVWYGNIKPLEKDIYIFLTIRLGNLLEAPSMQAVMREARVYLSKWQMKELNGVLHCCGTRLIESGFGFGSRVLMTKNSKIQLKKLIFFDKKNYISLGLHKRPSYRKSL
jgi:hypothetical protein